MWKAGIHFLIKTFEERYGLKVFPPTVLVWYPLTFLAAIVQIEHRCHCVYTESVNMVFFEPKQRITDKKALYFMSSIVKDQAAPFLMAAFSRIGMFE